MKKIINNPEDIVNEMCNGFVLANPELELDSKYRILYKKNINKNKVSLISGGGSGHEPAHAGFIGKGMLDSAVCGDVFASPSQIQVYKAIMQTASDKGTLLIIKNYSGDIMNFTNAAQMAKEDGVKVDFVKVDDDVAVEDSLYTVGQRGVAGTVFVHKIAGAAAERGDSLSEVKRIAEKTIENVRSIGIALTSCTVPAKGTPTFELGLDEMEYGIGIHGEPGISRKHIMDAHELAIHMIKDIDKKLNLKEHDNVAILVNGFGGTPLMELYIYEYEVLRELSGRNVIVHNIYVGNYMTSIEMEGVSLSILKLDDELQTLLDEPCDSPAVKINGPGEIIKFKDYYKHILEDEDVSYKMETPIEYGKIEEQFTLNNMIYTVDAMSESIIKNEVLFCEMDSHAGDGDFGMSIAKGFRQLKKEWKRIIKIPELDLSTFLNECALIIMEYCGGASGPIWGSAFRAAGKEVYGKSSLRQVDFSEMLQQAITGIQRTGEHSFGRGAVVGDKTLIDALVPCVSAWELSIREGLPWLTCFEKGAEAAKAGAEETKKIVARMGRAGTVGERSLGYPDAGAYALGIIFSDITHALR